MLTPVEREMVAAAAQAGRAAAERLVPGTVPGIVVSTDPTNTVALVQADGPNEAHGAQIIAPVALVPGDRVLLYYAGDKPSCYVLGRMSGDYDDWHVVGGDGEPQFVTGWGHDAGTLPPGQNGNAQVMFTRRSSVIHLAGRANRSSGVATNVFALPEWAWPYNDLLLAAQGNLGSHMNISIDYATGMLAVSTGSFVVLDGISYLARTQQPD